MQICMYCKKEMYGEYMTLSNHKYRFFYNCPNCGSLYEGIMFEKKKDKKVIESKWFKCESKNSDNDIGGLLKK